MLKHNFFVCYEACTKLLQIFKIVVILLDFLNEIRIS